MDFPRGFTARYPAKLNHLKKTSTVLNPAVFNSLTFLLGFRGTSTSSRAIVFRVATIIVSLVALEVEQSVPLSSVVSELFVRQALFFWPRIIFGVIVPIVLGIMIWSTVKIRHTQAATGLLYLAVVALLFGEFFSKFLLFSLSLPL